MADQIISLDTGEMTAMAASVNAANLELESCMARLALVTEHDDWSCAERDAINENIRRLQQNARRTQENMEQFAVIVRLAAEALDSLACELPADARQAAVELGNVCAIPSGNGGAVNTVAAAVAQKAADAVRTEDVMANYTVANLAGDIQLCRFDTFMPRGEEK